MPRESDIKIIEQLQEARSKIFTEIEKIIIGQKHIIEHLLISLFSRGHCLLIGVPGLAKTLLISSLSKLLDLNHGNLFAMSFLCNSLAVTSLKHVYP